MGYQALLFCPDEKTARTVTQVLGELEFTVEACIEPFAAVKKLMAQHFDAVVVDCDNEQNAALLFKSARNSTSNQASLAVAVVEGQVGVAKAFRIGANLVLTKPINIEQSKGTLRVARGLLRKGDPAKPATPAAAVTAASPAKPAAPKPVAPAKPAATATVPTPRPAAPPVAKPAAAAPPMVAAASSVPAARDRNEALPEIDILETAAPAPPPAPRPVLGSHPISIDVTSGFSSAPPAASAAAFGSGAASAPAPAREAQSSHAAEISPTSATKEVEALLAKPADAVADDAPSFVGSAPSFSFGGANAPVESNRGRTKIFLGIAAVVLVVAGLYAGWTYLQGRSSQSTSQPTSQLTSQPASQPSSIPAATLPAPVATQPATKPVIAAPKSTSTSTAPSTSPASSTVQPAVQLPADDAQPASSDADDDSAAKPTGSAKSSIAGSKSAATKSETAPIVVKGGAAPSVHTKPAAADTAAPSLIGIAAAGSSAPPPNLGNGVGNGPAPVLQALNISQGVSQGLLIKKVQPIYPRNALTMHVEGSVDLIATISTTGNITAVKVVSGEQLLTKAATDAVKQWKYKPYLLNGEPVEITTQITVNFKLPR
jgi:TonB family protein